jgi:hypothetical protein
MASLPLSPFRHAFVSGARRIAVNALFEPGSIRNKTLA